MVKLEDAVSAQARAFKLCAILVQHLLRDASSTDCAPAREECWKAENLTSLTVVRAQRISTVDRNYTNVAGQLARRFLTDAGERFQESSRSWYRGGANFIQHA